MCNVIMIFFLSTSEGRANVKHFAVLISGGDVSMNVDGTIHNAKLAADDGIEIFALGKLSPMSASLIFAFGKFSLRAYVSITDCGTIQNHRVIL